MKAIFSARMHARAFILLLGMVAITACAPSRHIRPLEKGEFAVGASLGGPLFTNFGYPMPAPMTTVTGAYGIKENLTGFASLHPTSAAFGLLQVDLGLSRTIFRPDGWQPGLSLSPVAGLALDLWEGKFKFWPQIDLNAWWEYGARKHYCYAGVSAWFELAGTRAHGEPQPQTILPAIQFGNVFSFGRVDYQIEFKANNFTQNSQDATISWLSLGKNGGVGVYLGVSKRF